MANADLDAVRWDYAELTGLFEDWALIVPAGPGVMDLNEGRRRFNRLATAMQRIRRQLAILEGHLR